MSTTILATKLYVPPPRPKLVRRPRLIERLEAGLPGKLSLISAPAGFGKTTLISEWLADCQHPAAWLSLDEADNDPTRFLTYLITALQTPTLNGAEGGAGNIGEAALELLQSSQSPQIESILTALLNEITTTPDKLILVLDDYHVIDAQPVLVALAFLLEFLPQQMHLVIATREDPNLPLARFRARGQLTELRAADLRFTPSEAAEFLNQVMNLSLSAEEVTSLESRTEGWIAGLQLAALSMRGREDIPGFIRAFAGDNRYIVDYLVEEVLQRQPEAVRNFLLQTSILGRLNGSLCDAVTGQEQGSLLLENLERANLFVVPLDDKRHWYRYHHLFADVLHAHSMKEQPDQEPALHRRASEWYEQNNLPSDAIRHALAAQDLERAADLIELAWQEMDMSRQTATWLGWVKTLPEAITRARPVLSVGYAWALLNGGNLEAAETWLRAAERWLDMKADGDEAGETPAAEMVVVDKSEFRFLPATIASARTYLAQALGDVPATLKYAQLSLDLLPEDDHLRRGIPASLLALASWTNGDLEAAGRFLTDAMISFQKAGNILFAITGTYVLADIRMAQGRLREAFNAYQESLALAKGQGKLVLRGTADLYTGLAELYYEQNDLEAATQHLLRSRELGEKADLPRWHFRWCLAQARIKEAQGDLEGALELVDEAERQFVRGPVPEVRPIAALKTRLWVVQGRLSEAWGWVRQQGLSVDDDLSYLREFEHLTLARALTAEYKSGRSEQSILEAVSLLERLLKAAEAGRRMGSVIEILVLQAMAYQAQGNTALALAPLARALAVAEPEGYIRIFVDEGQPMAQLLSEAAVRGITPDYTRRLLAAFDMEAQKDDDTAYQAPVQPLVEPLSERELEILQLISQGLSNREIGERLFLALDTIKGHNRRIFGKLQVRRRTEAVAKARSLNIIPRNN